MLHIGMNGRRKRERRHANPIGDKPHAMRTKKY